MGIDKALNKQTLFLESDVALFLESDAAFHEGCDPSSKCRKKKNFILSAKGISSEEANFLRSAIEKTHFFQHPENYLLRLTTSVVESSHRVHNIYRDKTTKYGEEEYDMRIDLATLHFDECIKGKYENGMKVNGTEYSKGPKQLEKQVLTERRFIPFIDQDYFDEMMLLSKSKTEETSKKSTVSGTFGVEKPTDQIVELSNPESIPTTTTASLVYNTSPPTTVSVMSMSSTSAQSIKASATLMASQAVKANAICTTGFTKVQLPPRKLGTMEGQICVGAVSQVPMGRTMEGQHAVTFERRLQQRHVTLQGRPPKRAATIQRPPLLQDFIIQKQSLEQDSTTQKPPLQHDVILQRRVQQKVVTIQKLPLQGATIQRATLQQGVPIQSPPVQHGAPIQSPPVKQGVTIQRPPLQQGATIQRPPVLQGATIQRPPMQQGDTIQRPPMQHASTIQRTPMQHAPTIQRPPMQCAPTIQIPLLQQGATIQSPYLQHAPTIQRTPLQHALTIQANPQCETVYIKSPQ